MDDINTRPPLTIVEHLHVALVSRVGHRHLVRDGVEPCKHRHQDNGRRGLAACLPGTALLLAAEAEGMDEKGRRGGVSVAARISCIHRGLGSQAILPQVQLELPEGAHGAGSPPKAAREVRCFVLVSEEREWWKPDGWDSRTKGRRRCSHRWGKHTSKYAETHCAAKLRVSTADARAQLRRSWTSSAREPITEGTAIRSSADSPCTKNCVWENGDEGGGSGPCGHHWLGGCVGREAASRALRRPQGETLDPGANRLTSSAPRTRHLNHVVLAPRPSSSRRTSLPRRPRTSLCRGSRLRSPTTSSTSARSEFLSPGRVSYPQRENSTP
jgi:hypothetical protein